MSERGSWITRRPSLRLRGYNYAHNGAYLVTLCVEGRRRIFGEIREGRMLLNDVGRMAVELWEAQVDRFSHLRLDEFVVMPDHMHGIVWLEPTGNREVNAESLATVGQIVGAFKSETTNTYMRCVEQGMWAPFAKRLWQRGFHDKVLRDEEALANAREYVVNNPQRWEFDRMDEERRKR